MLEKEAKYGGHVLGSGEADVSYTRSYIVFVRQLMGAELSNRQSEILLLAYLSVEISYDNLDVLGCGRSCLRAARRMRRCHD